MKFATYNEQGKVHAVMSEHEAVEAEPGCETCGRGGRRPRSAQVRLWCQGRPVYAHRLTEHDGPATCKGCLRVGLVAMDARERSSALEDGQ